MLWWTLKGSVILLLAFAAAFLLRRRPAAVRHAVWTVAIAAQLLLPLAPRMIPELAVDVAVPRSVAAVEAWPVANASREPRRAEAAPLHFRATPAAPRDWLRLALVAGTALLGFRLLFGTARIMRVGRRAQRVTDGAWLSLTSSLCGTLRITRPVTLLRTDALTMPVTWGFLYPVILLPAASEQWPEALRRHVLLHELAHVRRFDALAQLAAQCALALFWFNPLLWLAARQMRAEAEHACDDYVLRNGEPPSRYAQTLVELVQAHTAMRLPAFATLGAGTRSDLETRVRAITSPLRDASSRRALLTAATGVAAAIVLPLSAVHPKEIKTPPAAPRSAACRPLFLDDYPFSETSGTLTANGRTTHYFFLRPEPGRCLEASFSLDARFTDDDRDLVPTPGLQALVHETRGGDDRAVFIDERGGRLQRRYLVSRVEQPWDADAQRWYEDVLPDVIRRSYAGATPRAERFLRAGGVEGVFDELARIPILDVRARYLESLLVLTPDELTREKSIARAREVLDGCEPCFTRFLTAMVRHRDPRVRIAAMQSIELVDDSFRRQFLEQAVPWFLGNDGMLVDAWFRAAAEIGNPSERRELLSLVRTQELAPAVIARLDAELAQL